MENILMTSRKKTGLDTVMREKMYHLSKQSQETRSEDRDSKNGINPQCLKMFCLQTIMIKQACVP